MYIYSFFSEDLINKGTLKNILNFWFARAVCIWENQLPHPAVLTLALNFAVFLLSEEQFFIKLNETNTIERFIKLLKSMLKMIGATPDVGYIKLLACVLKHDSGFKWMISTNYWSEILSMDDHVDQRPNLGKEKTIFFTDFLKKSVHINSDFCSKTLHFLMTPFVDFSGMVKNKKSLNEDFFNLNCLPKLCLLENIMELLFENEINETTLKITKLVLLTSQQLQFEKHVIAICRDSINEDVNYKLMNMAFSLNELELICSAVGTPVLEYATILPYLEKCESLRRKLHGPFQKLFPKIVFNWQQKYSKFGHLLPEFKMPNGVVCTIGDSLMFTQLMPIFCVSYCFCHKRIHNDEFRDTKNTEKLKKIPPIKYYHFYEFRDYLDDQFSFEYLMVCIEYLLKSKSFYNRESAIATASVLFYGLEDFIVILKKYTEITPDALNYLGSLIDAIKEFTVEFNLTWQDTFESVTLLETIRSIFSIPGMNSQVSVT